jgi:hypothetical protein
MRLHLHSSDEVYVIYTDVNISLFSYIVLFIVGKKTQICRNHETWAASVV